ncbi:MAG: geranylgeranylglyceryl/heptaprenylglyceryl phosphate synthase [Candidatus Hadarchaeota archaeon]|nr:geranylgeranylglyceryl/heptaprenylglyceryl phosphate synthase [Candidatus Hadarchaeota archaeon]
MRVSRAACEGEGVEGMKVEERLREIIARDSAAHLTLIDPAKQEPGVAGEMASDAAAAGTDGIMVGGSTRAGDELLDRTVLEVKKAVDLPVVLFPASEAGISRHADAVFFMSLLSSEDPYHISGAQRLGAPLVKEFGLEPIPMAYLIVEPGGAAARVGKAKPIPRDGVELAAAYALAAQYMGMRFIYLEAGSGAEEPVPVEMVQGVKSAVDVVLVVGGGIRTPEAAADSVKAGADIIVTGTLVEGVQDRVKKIGEIVRAIK